LRAGAITLEQLRTIEPKTQIYRVQKSEPPRSPGLRHRHYSPQAKVVLVSSKFKVQSSKSISFIGLNEPDEKFELLKVCVSVEEYAHELFNFFRECDHKNIKTIHCETVEEKGIGLALMDRLKRASESGTPSSRR